MKLLLALVIAVGPLLHSHLAAAQQTPAPAAAPQQPAPQPPQAAGSPAGQTPAQGSATAAPPPSDAASASSELGGGVVEAQLAAELARSAVDGCMKPVLLGLLNRTQDEAELMQLMAENCEAIVRSARDHLRAAGALRDTAPTTHEMALGMAAAAIRERLPYSSRKSRPVAGGVGLAPGGALLSHEPTPSASDFGYSGSFRR